MYHRQDGEQEASSRGYRVVPKNGIEGRQERRQRRREGGCCKHDGPRAKGQGQECRGCARSQSKTQDEEDWLIAFSLSVQDIARARCHWSSQAGEFRRTRPTPHVPFSQPPRSGRVKSKSHTHTVLLEAILWLSFGSDHMKESDMSDMRKITGQSSE